MCKGKRLRLKKKQQGKGFGKQFSDRFSENFQREVRNSELWDQMVSEFGEEGALELIKGCKADIVSPDFE